MLRQITKEEFSRADYRKEAEILRPIDDLVDYLPHGYIEFNAEGLGPARSAYFVTSSGMKFALCEYLQPNPSITEIIVEFSAGNSRKQILEVLSDLGLEVSDLSFIR